MNASINDLLAYLPVAFASALLLPRVLMQLAAYRHTWLCPAEAVAEAQRLGLGETAVNRVRLRGLAQRCPGPLTEALAAAADHAGRSADEVARVIRAAADGAFTRLGAGLTTVGFFANAGPLFGLLGAVMMLSRGFQSDGADQIGRHFGGALYALLGGVVLTVGALFAHMKLRSRHARAEAEIENLLAPLPGRAASWIITDA